MGFWDSVKSFYSKADKKLGGYLPGGITPSEAKSSSTSTSSSTTTTSSTSTSSSGGSTSASSGGGGSSGGSSGGVSSQTLAPQQQDAVIVTDFTTGESVKTKISPSGEITSQTYSSGGSSGSSQLGEQQAISLASREEGLVSSTQEQKTTSYGATLQPQTYITTKQYNPNEPPERYNRPLSSAVGESFRNVFNFGIIGQQGIGAYTRQAFFTPFKYVGTPKAYKEMPNYNLQNWEGTEFGYGMSEEQKQLYRPVEFQDKTYYQFSEQQKRGLYSEAGLAYTGEPARILPQRIGENIVNELRPKYEGQLATDTKELYGYYQGKVNAGELTQEQAQTEYNRVLQARTAVVNTQFQREATSIYQERTAGLNEKITKIERFEAEIFEPPAYPVIRNIGRGIETGAIVGASAFGGSGVTLAASTYIGVKTASSTVKYAGAFNELSTGQKVLGGAGIAAGAAATLYTFNLGVTKFYSEWRNIVYTDLAAQRGTTAGREVLRTEEFTRYEIASVRQQGINRAVTTQDIDVYQTGANRVGFFGKGRTTTTIYDPQYEKLVTTTQNFRTSGNVPNIEQGGLSVIRQGEKITYTDTYTGLGRAKYISGENVVDYRFITASRDVGEYYQVAGATQPQRSFSRSSGGVSYYSTTIRGRFDSTGSILKLPGTSDLSSNIITTGGKRSSQEFFNNLYGVGASAGVQTTREAQIIGTQSLAKSGASVGVGAASIAAVGARQIRTINLPAAQQIQEPQTATLNYSLPQLNQILPQQQELEQAALYSSSYGGLYSGVSAASGQEVALIQGQTQDLATSQAQKLNLRTGLLTPNIALPNYLAPPEVTGGRGVPPPFFFRLSPGGFILNSNVIKGGTRRTAFTPSFSAIVFNIRGAYRPQKSLARSGINFRPITKKFKFKTGL